MRRNSTVFMALGLTFLMVVPALAQMQALKDRPVTMETLLDRIQIEDLLTRYYFDLSAGKSHELAEYFTADALLDVDGTVAKGHAQIAKLYQRPAEPAAVTKRRNHMVLSNPIINVEGTMATAHVLWTGVTSEGIGKVPSIYEQGREYSELRKENGKWLIAKRYISSDGRMSNRFDPHFKPREHR
jgi:ketosteroid isomerase-like protein